MPGAPTRTVIQVDWENREFVEGLVQGIQRLADFLTRFGTPTRGPPGHTGVP